MESEDERVAAAAVVRFSIALSANPKPPPLKRKIA